jgi:5-methylthioadenosine/S-adenosylhomocysteine deaminase
LSASKNIKFASSFQASQAPGNSRSLGFKNLVIFDPPKFSERSSFQQNQGLLIEDGLIKERGLSQNLEEKYPDVLFMDATGYLAMPGLVDGHTHVAMSFLRDLAHGQDDLIESVFFPAEKSLNEKLVECLAYSSLLSALQSGTTCILDHYYFSEGVGRALEKLGMRGAIGETVSDLGGPFAGLKTWQRAQKQIENWKFSDRIKPVIAPHAMDTVSPELMKELAAYARKASLPLHYHLAQTKKERDRVFEKHQKTPVQLAFDCEALGEDSLVVHCLSVDEQDLESIKKSGAFIGFCPSSQVIYEHLAPIDQFTEKQIPFLLGSDCAASNDSFDLFKELKVAALFAQDRLKNKDIDLSDLFIRSVFTNPSRYLEKFWLLGQIKKNHEADISFLKLSSSQLPINRIDTNVIYSQSAKQVEHVMVNGKWVLWNREPAQMELDELEGLYSESLEEIYKTSGIPAGNILSPPRS